MGESQFRVIYLHIVTEEHIPNLPKSVRNVVRKAIEDRLMTNPIAYGKPLRFSLKGYRRLRIGRYRIIYTVNCPSKTVTIVAIDHRKDVYAD